MQSAIAGLEWRQEYAIGRRFYAARAEVPAARVLISVGAEVGAMPTVLHNLYIFWLGNRFFHDVLDFLYFTLKDTFPRML